MDKLLAWRKLEIPYGNGKVLEFKNRYMIPPMVSWVAKDGFVNEFHIARYAFAMGGYGSIVVEATSVDPNGRISKGDLGLWNDGFIPGMKRLADSLHADYYKGVKVGVQLAHAGRKCSSAMPWEGFYHIPPEDGGFSGVAPSAIPFAGSTTPKALTNEEVKETAQKYVAAAVRAQKAGMDFVEVHGAHGYLVNQFLCSSTNKRTDEYGGSFENRIRFLLQIVAGIKEKCGENFPVFVRLSCDEGLIGEKKDDEEYNKKVREANKIRWTIRETCKLVGELIKAGVCFIDTSFGSVNAGQIWNTFPMYMVEYSKEIKKNYGVKIHTSCVGEISKGEEVEKILKDGLSDVVQIGRTSLANPYVPYNHLKEHGVDKLEILKPYVVQHSYAIYRLWMRK